MGVLLRPSLQYNDKRINTIYLFYHGFFILLPVLMVYNFPIVNISMGTALLVLFIPHVMVYMLFGNYRSSIGAVFLILLFYIYLSLRSGWEIKTIVLYAAAFIHFCGFAVGSLRTQLIRKWMERFAVLNTAAVLVQTVLHYLFNTDVRFILVSLLQRDYQQNYMVAPSGSLYRPCAFFLEPAFFSEYCLFALISLLFPEEGFPKIKLAVIVSMGIIMTTSGMGIVLTVCVWGWFVLWRRESLNRKTINIVKYLLLGIAVFVVLVQIPFFQSAIQRVFSNLDGYNALEGRTGHLVRAISSMSRSDLWLGYGGGKEYPFYLSGFPDTIYQFGLIGVMLELLIFIHLSTKKKSAYVRCCTIVFLALFCIAHLMGVFNHLFYMGILMVEIYGAKQEPTSVSKGWETSISA